MFEDARIPKSVFLKRLADVYVTARGRDEVLTITDNMAIELLTLPWESAFESDSWLWIGIKTD